MKKGYLYEKISNIDEKYIIGAIDPVRFRKKKVSFSVRKIVLLAACIALVTAACVAVPFMIKNDDVIDIPGPDTTQYDFSSPEYADFEMDGTTLVAYKGEGAAELTVPEGIEKIADYAFYGNTNSSSIKVICLSSTVTKLENNAFAGCSELESLLVGDNAEFVERDGLLMTANGETILKYIGDTKITSFTIPDGVKYIAAHAFQMTELWHVKFPEGLLYIGYNAFAGLPLSEIHLPNSMIELADGAFGGCCWAFEGSYPESMKFTKSSFDIVPFYLTMLAGEPCPSEDIGKNNITITEAFKKSNTENITKQLSDALEYYNTGVIPEETFCYASLSNGPQKPDGAIIPDIDSLDFAFLELVEQSWDGYERTNISIVIPCEGSYDLMLGYRLYDRWDCLYWEDVRWRIEEISFIPTRADQSADLVIGDWFIEFEVEPANDYEPRDLYKGITFTHRDGRSIFESRFDSYAPYEFQISPDGNSFIVEYQTVYGWCFFIEDLTGKLYDTCWSYEAPCVPWFEKGDGKYLAHSALWNTDPETMDIYPIRGTSEKGKFLMNYNTGNIYRDDMYIYYDLLYLTEGPESEWGSVQITRDGSDKYAAFCARIYWTADGAEGGELLNENYNATTYGIIYKVPSTWYMGMYDEYRTGDADNWRAEYPGRAIKVSENFEMKVENVFMVVPEKVDTSTFKLVKGDGKYIKEYSVVETVQMLVSTFRKSCYVEIRTPDNYIIPIFFYTYSDGDSADYFNRVIRPTIESVRLCNTAVIEEKRAEKKNDGQFMTVTFKDGEETLSGTLSLKDIVDLESYTEDDSIIHDPSINYDFLGMHNFMVLKIENGSQTDYYLTFEGVFVNKYSFVLKGEDWVRLE